MHGGICGGRRHNGVKGTVLNRTDEERDRALLETNWQDVAIRLTGYALWKLRNLHWRGGPAASLLPAKAAEDFAGEAILRVIDGRRSWNPERGPLLPYLRGVVDSLLSHMSQSREHNNATLKADMDTFAAGSPGASLDDERVVDLRRALARAGEQALLEIVDAVLDDTDATPRGLAEHLCTSVPDINNRLKRLRRFAHRQAANRTRMEIERDD
jgi:DNA-directed RNA polymerase specialized sigma24 family protein